MATGTKSNSVNDSAYSYCKMPDGTLIQFGTLSNVTVNLTQANNLLYQQTSSDIRIDFPVAFANNSNYRVFGTFQYSTGSGFPIAVSANAKTQTYCLPTISDVYPRSGNEGRIDWCAIGRWR